MTALIEMHDLLIQRGDQAVLQVDHLAVEEGEVLAVIGPNGAGKSTLLLALSQLVQPARGEINFKGQVLDPKKTLAYRRRIALVLQDPLLVDTSVYENVATGLHFRHMPAAEVEQRVDRWLSMLGILDLRQRSARRLSGGEAQRVSLARAFALQPELLLLDEPFSALDAPTRARLLDDLQAVLAATGTTTIVVTHDLNEALVLGKRVAVLLDGNIRQIGPPEQVFSTPADAQVAAFVGVETVIAGQVTALDEGLVSISAGGFHLEVIGEVEPGRLVWVCLRPEDVTLWAGSELPRTSARNRLAGKITRLVPQGALVRVSVECEGGVQIVALVTRSSAREMGLEPGQPVLASFKASAAHLISR